MGAGAGGGGTTEEAVWLDEGVGGCCAGALPGAPVGRTCPFTKVNSTRS